MTEMELPPDVKKRMAEVTVRELPPELKRSCDELTDESLIADEKGNISRAFRLYLQEWKLIPEPKESYTFESQTLSRAIAAKYLKLGDAEKFKEWMAIVYQMYFDPKAESYPVVIYYLMNEGTGLYKLGRKDEALAIFRKAWRIAGRDAFPLENVEYYKFMMAHQDRY